MAKARYHSSRGVSNSQRSATRRAKARKIKTERHTGWRIYIPAESDPYGLGGHYEIDYAGDDPRAARAAYLKWAKRQRLPAGAVIESLNSSSSQKE